MYIFLFISSIICIISGSCCKCCTCCINKKLDSKDLNKINKTQILQSDKNITSCLLYLKKNNINNDETKIPVFFKFTDDEIKEIGRRYLEILNKYSDEVKTLDEVTNKKLTSEEILNFLHINEALTELNKIDNSKDKVIKIIDILYNEVNTQQYNFEDFNLLSPRCLIIHENYNCVIESWITHSLSNPYFVKFYYLLYQLFLQKSLSAKDYPLTFETSKCVYNAVNNPNFNDKIRAISILKSFFDNYKDKKIKVWNNEYVLDYFTRYEDKNFGTFQSMHLTEYIGRIIRIELEKLIHDDYKNVNKNIKRPLTEVLGAVNHSWNNPISDSNISEIENYLLLNKNDIPDINLYKSHYIETEIIFNFIIISFNNHQYTIKNINNTFIKYDDLDIHKPTVVSEKYLMRNILNNFLNINNFNSDYSNSTVQVFYFT